MSEAIPSTTLQPGLYVGYGLETPAANFGSTDADRININGYVAVNGLAISNGGLITTVNSSPGASDQLAFLDANGQLLTSVTPAPIPVVDANGNPLSGIQGLAWGDPNLTGSQQLFAIYDLNNGNGPVLGTITIDFGSNRAFFLPLGGGMGLVGAHVEAMAFYNHETARDPAHQGLYVVAEGGVAGLLHALSRSIPCNRAVSAVPTLSPSGSSLPPTALPSPPMAACSMRTATSSFPTRSQGSCSM